MKKLLIFVIAMAMTWASYAQNATEEETGDKPHAMVEHIFGLLDKMPITTKRLWDRAIDFMPMDAYNGHYLSDSTDLDVNKFAYLYTMMSMAITDSTALPNPRDLYNYSLANTAPIPLVGLLQRYNYLKSSAVMDDLVRLNLDERLEDVANRTKSPYAEDTLFAATPIVEYFNSTSPQMIFPLANFVSNLGQIRAIKIDFGNGGIAVNFGQIFTPNLHSGMNQKATISIMLMNGQVLQSRFIYHVANPDGSFRSGPDLPYDGINNFDTLTVTATKGFNGNDGKGIRFATAKVTTYYSCTDKRIRKPLIILDGFNPADPGKNSASAKNIIDGFNFFASTPLSPTNSPRVIAKEFRKEGYDIIFVDWLSENGNDYIQRNAFLLQNIIERINTEKRTNGSTEKNVLMGYSMGGLIGKYAILDFEKNNPNAADGGHDIWKFLSYDSPLQGANIPLAGQKMLNDLGGIEVLPFLGLKISDFVPAIDNKLKLLASPAARQMLIAQVSKSILSPTFAPRDFNNFFTEINALGRIRKCEFLTITNGSVTGIANFPAGTNLLTWNVNIKNQKHKLLKFKFDLIVNALPNGTSGGSAPSTTIYDRNMNWSILINNFSPLVKTKNHVKLKVEGAIRPLDSCPGGTTGLFSSISKDLPGGTVSTGMYVNLDF